MTGTRLGPWSIDQELGRGGMGTVYRAHRDSAGEPAQAAVKVLAAELSVEAGFRLHFQREIDILRQLDHPHIVRFLESGTEQDRYYFVREYVPGPSLETLLAQQGRLPWAEVLDLALQVAPALKHAHDRGVIHRDLEPSNLPRTPDPEDPVSPGLVKLTDFGIASLFAGPHLTVNWRKTPSPRFSTAGSQDSSRASGAATTPICSSPSTSGVLASKRVKPSWATTSRRR
jgi:serine/threonine-protein kinase